MTFAPTTSDTVAILSQQEMQGSDICEFSSLQKFDVFWRTGKGGNRRPLRNFSPKSVLKYDHRTKRTLVEIASYVEYGMSSTARRTLTSVLTQVAVAARG